MANSIFNLNPPVNLKYDCDKKSLDCESPQAMIVNHCDICGGQFCRNHMLHLHGKTIDKDIRVCYTCVEARKSESNLTRELVREDINANYKNFNPHPRRANGSKRSRADDPEGYFALA